MIRSDFVNTLPDNSLNFHLTFDFFVDFSNDLDTH